MKFDKRINSMLMHCLIFNWTIYSFSRIEGFLVPKTKTIHPQSSFSDSSIPLHKSFHNAMHLLPQHHSFLLPASRAKSRLWATIERGSMQSSASDSSGKSKSMGESKQQVLYQKVIRPTPNMPDVLFLGYLIEYLEQHFELPTDLPMIYDNMVVDGNSNSEDRYTLAWDSPLSPSADDTRMEVEVVGIYTDDTKSNSKDDDASDAASNSTPSVPNMAMVVVRRPNQTANNNSQKKASAVPPMMKGLFDDSEKRIIQALDRGLDDFVAGKIKFEMDDQLAEHRTKGEIPNVKNAQEAIEAELVDEVPNLRGDDDNKVAPEDVVFDAYATEDTEETSPPKPQPTPQEIADAKARAMATMQQPVQEATKKKTSAPIDFAVEAAKKAAQQKQQQQKAKASPTKNAKKSSDSATATVDFAVAQARKIAAKRKSASAAASKPKEDFAVAAARKRATSISKGKNKVRGASSTKEQPKYEVISSEYRNGPQPSASQKTTQGPAMPPVPKGWKPRDHFKDQRAFSGTISTPKKFLGKNGNQKKSKTAVAASKLAARQRQSMKQQPKHRASAVAAKISELSKKAEAETIPKPKGFAPKPKTKDSIGKRKVSVKLVDKEGEKDDASVEPLLNEAVVNNDGDKTPSKEEIQMEIMKAAKTALDEIEEQGEDMTAEEMLRDILKFDEEKKKEEKPGGGFATGAFEKAKELMKDRHRQIQDRQTQGRQQQQELGLKEIEKPEPSSFPKPPTPLSEEEELRQMFAAGQRIADGKITTKLDSNSDVGSSIQASGTTEEDVDRLIAEEKTVSKYARVLDDELAELEVRINSSPGEELDGPPQNPIFDVMSGPEVYDPNVEMDAVNYPGALPGTADVKLPKQLDEAIKQAEFAAGVIMQLEEREIRDEATGQTTVKYFSGKRELNAQQVKNLRKVVKGAVDSGIIADPVEIMAEASRLQLVLDELWNQPEERFYEVASNYKDLLLSDRFVVLIQQRMKTMAERDLDALRNDDESLREPHEKERNLLGKLVNYAQALLKETRALGAELEATQLEVVRSICKVAMDPEHETAEETAMALSDAVRDMRPLLDDSFVAYLKYAVAEEEARLARAGLVDDPDYNQWLFVLKIVQQGVYAEIAKGINRYIEHIWYVLRMETPQQRRQLLSDLIDDMPTMDVRPFVRVVENIVGSLGDGIRGNFDGLVPLGEMTNTLLQLQNDVQELLPPERIAEKSKDADEWAAKQRKRLMEQRQIGRQRLQAVKDTSGREEDIEAAFGESGEVERFD